MVVVWLLVNFISQRENEGFTASNECWDVFAAMELTTKLLLEEYSVHDSHSKINDSLMKLIKNTSEPGPDHAPINNNSFGRVNKKFVCLQIRYNNIWISIYKFICMVSIVRICIYSLTWCAINKPHLRIHWHISVHIIGWYREHYQHFSIVMHFPVRGSNQIWYHLHTYTTQYYGLRRNYNKNPKTRPKNNLPEPTPHAPPRSPPPNNIAVILPSEWRISTINSIRHCRRSIKITDQASGT